jgi:ABC-2 type transport system ATP-binding protein
LEHLLQKRLLVDVHDKKSAQAELIKDGYSVNTTEEGVLEMTDKRAINRPDSIATILVNVGLPPTLLRVEEEDLESYFLRIVAANRK